MLLSRSAFPRAQWTVIRRDIACYGSRASRSFYGLYDACVPPTASYACEVWGCYAFGGPNERSALQQQHLKALKQILGVRSTVSTEVVMERGACEAPCSTLVAEGSQILE